MLVLTLVPFLKKDRSGDALLSLIVGFVTYFFIGIGLRGLFLLEGYLDNHLLAPVENDALAAYVFFLACVALVSLYAGYYANFPERMGKRLARRPILARKSEPPLVATIFGILCAFVGFFSLYMFRDRFAYLIVFGENPAAIQKLTLEGGIAPITMLLYFPLAGCLMILSRRRWSFLEILLFLVNFCACFVWFAMMGSKTVLVFFMLGILIITYYRYRRFSKKVVAVVGSILIIAFWASAQYRSYGIEGLSELTQDPSQETPALLVPFIPLLQRSYHFDVFLLEADKVRSIEDLYLGASLRELLFFYVPRAWWPDKPDAFGYQFGEEFLDPTVYFRSSYATSLAGELYLNFHIVGLVLGFWMIGIAMRVVCVGLTTAESAFSIVLYATLYGRFVHLVEGPIASHIEFTIQSLLPFVVYLILRGILPSGRAKGFR